MGRKIEQTKNRGVAFVIGIQFEGARRRATLERRSEGKGERAKEEKRREEKRRGAG